MPYSVTILKLKHYCVAFPQGARTKYLSSWNI